MAKEKFLTRTMKSTTASILCMDIDVAEPCNKVVHLAGTFKDADAILKASRPIVEKGSIKAVSVADYQVETALYKMSENFFLANATKVEK